MNLSRAGGKVCPSHPMKTSRQNPVRTAGVRCPKAGFGRISTAVPTAAGILGSAPASASVLSPTPTVLASFSRVSLGRPARLPGYRKKPPLSRRVSGEIEAVVCGTAKIKEQPCALFVMEPSFMMGSMGTAVGEKITRLIEYATEKRLAVVGHTVSAARMQGGTAVACADGQNLGGDKKAGRGGALLYNGAHRPDDRGRHRKFCDGGRHYCCRAARYHRVCRPACYRAGQRGGNCPDGFQSAEFLLERGFVDLIVPRERQRQVCRTLLKCTGRQCRWLKEHLKE